MPVSRIVSASIALAMLIGANLSQAALVWELTEENESQYRIVLVVTLAIGTLRTPGCNADEFAKDAYEGFKDVIANSVAEGQLSQFDADGMLLHAQDEVFRIKLRGEMEISPGSCRAARNLVARFAE